MSHNTASLLKMCRLTHASKGLPTSRIGKNFQASEISWDNTAERKNYIFWGVPKGRGRLSRTGMTPQDRTYCISMDSKPAVSANPLFTLKLLAWYLSFSREYHICYISEIPGVKMQFMYYTKIRWKGIFIQIQFNAFCLLNNLKEDSRDWSFLKDHTR